MKELSRRAMGLFSCARLLIALLILTILPTLTACASEPDLKPTVSIMTQTLKDIRYVFDEAKLTLNKDKAKNRAEIDSLKFRLDMAIKNGETAIGGKDKVSMNTKTIQYNVEDWLNGTGEFDPGCMIEQAKIAARKAGERVALRYEELVLQVIAGGKFERPKSRRLINAGEGDFIVIEHKHEPG